MEKREKKQKMEKREKKQKWLNFSSHSSDLEYGILIH